MRNLRQAQQSGFVGVVFLAIALIGIVIAAIAAMSRSSASGTADQAAKTNAAIIIKQASDFKSGVDRMIINGTNPVDISFDQTVGTGLFDPTPGAQFAVKNVPPGAAFDGTNATPPQYTYSRLVRLPGIGAASANDYVVTASGTNGLTLAVCQQINKMLYNDLTTGAPAVSTGTGAAWSTTPVAIDDSGVGSVNYAARPEGCVRTSDSKYVYYKAVVEN